MVRKAGDLTVEGSQRYAAWDSDLYQSEVWATRRDAWYQEQELPRDADTFLSTMLDQLHRQTLHVSNQTLYRAKKGGDYGVIAPTLKKDIKVHLIMEHWDDLNRVATSLKDGLIRPSILISKLQAMQQQNPFQQALQELGRILKIEGKAGRVKKRFCDILTVSFVLF